MWLFLTLTQQVNYINFLVFYNSSRNRWNRYSETSNISGTLIGNKLVDHLDVVGALPLSTTIVPIILVFWDVNEKHFTYAGFDHFIILISFLSVMLKLCISLCGLGFTWERVSEWVIKFNGLSRTADSEVHIVHISRVIIACTLKSLSSPT